MTAKEAIEKLERNKAIMCHGCMHPQMVGWCENHCQMPEALDMAIEALSAEPKREECEEREQGLCPFYAG